MWFNEIDDEIGDYLVSRELSGDTKAKKDRQEISVYLLSQINGTVGYICWQGKQFRYFT